MIVHLLLQFGGTAYTDVWPDSESKLVSCITAISTPLSNVYKYLNSGSGITNCGNIQKWSIETVKNSVIKICPVLVECNGSAFYSGWLCNDKERIF